MPPGTWPSTPWRCNLVDPDFANQQLDLMMSDLYLHPNGQIPAYEWNFSDVNPPVHAWATFFNYSRDELLGPEQSRLFEKYLQ